MGTDCRTRSTWFECSLVREEFALICLTKLSVHLSLQDGDVSATATKLWFSPLAPLWSQVTESVPRVTRQVEVSQGLETTARLSAAG